MILVLVKGKARACNDMAVDAMTLSACNTVLPCARLEVSMNRLPSNLSNILLGCTGQFATTERKSLPRVLTLPAISRLGSALETH